MKWTDYEVEILKQEYPKENLNFLCKKLKRKLVAVSAKAERMGIFRKTRINLAEKNGGGINEDYYRRVALENQPDCCALCGKREWTGKEPHIHHKDKNRKNNKIENLLVVCAKCHGKIHRILRIHNSHYKNKKGAAFKR